MFDLIVLFCRVKEKHRVYKSSKSRHDPCVHQRLDLVWVKSKFLLINFPKFHCLENYFLSLIPPIAHRDTATWESCRKKIQKRSCIRRYTVYACVCVNMLANNSKTKRHYRGCYCWFCLCDPGNERRRCLFAVAETSKQAHDAQMCVLTRLPI